jgi:hypothetical protein
MVASRQRSIEASATAAKFDGATAIGTVEMP